VRQDANKKPVAAYEVTLSVSEAPPKGGSLWVMLFFGFLGGLILNFMPCVLPVIALKVLSFVGQSKEAPARVRHWVWCTVLGCWFRSSYWRCWPLV